MQTYSERSSGGFSSQTRRIAMLAILLFGLSGLISGFAVGAFVRPKLPGTTGSSSNNGTTPAITGSTTTKTTSQVHPIKIGYPVADNYAYTEKANGTTTYTFSAHAVDTSKDAGHGNPLHAAGITCKLWIERIPGNGQVDLPGRKLAAVELQDPLTPDEIRNGLTFTTTTPQIQQTNTQGQVTWTYSVSSNVDAGVYYLVVLMDWQGKYYQWSWYDIHVQGTGH